MQRHNEATQARKPDRRQSVKLHRAFGTLFLVVSRLAGDVAQGAKGLVAEQGCALWEAGCKAARAKGVGDKGDGNKGHQNAQRSDGLAGKRRGLDGETKEALNCGGSG